MTLRSPAWKRFRANRRGWWSLWIFVALYAASLCAGLFCRSPHEVFPASVLDPHLRPAVVSAGHYPVAAVEVAPPSVSLRSPAPPAGEPEGDPDPGAESAESAEAEAAKAEAEKAKAEAAALKDRLLRLQADFDNFRKRQARDRAEWIQQSNADLLEELLPVLDQTDAAIASVSKDSSEAAKPFREGFELVRRSFLNAVAKFGLKPVEGVVGKPLDTATSEAITIMRTGQTAPGCVVYETRKGYSLNGKVLRAAQVVVEDEAEEPAPEAEKPAEEPAPAEPAGNQEA